MYVLLPQIDIVFPITLRSNEVDLRENIDRLIHALGVGLQPLANLLGVAEAAVRFQDGFEAEQRGADDERKQTAGESVGHPKAKAHIHTHTHTHTYIREWAEIVPCTNVFDWKVRHASAERPCSPLLNYKGKHTCTHIKLDLA